MSILGPDGQPIQTGPPVAPEVRQIVDQVKEIAAQGDPAAALQQMVLAFQQDVSSDLVLNTTCELLEKIQQVAGAQANEELDLFKRLREERNNPEAYYIIGSRFFHLGQTFIARPFMARAQELLGTDTNELRQQVDVEYGQILMELGAYQPAVDILQALNDDYGGLPVELILKMSECYALLRQTDEAEALYEVVTDEAVAGYPGLEEWRDEVGDLIARVQDFGDRETLGLREWHYVQSRSILLETNPDENMPGERFVFFTPSEEDIAYVVSLTAAILDKKGYGPTRLLWLGESAEPLARLFAEWWELDEENIRPYQSGDNHDDENDMGLLVMGHSFDVMSLPNEEALMELFPARAGLIIFALDMHWTDRQPITPDISGFMTQMCHMPWEAKVEMRGNEMVVTPITEKPDARAIATALAAQFPNEQECDEFAEETLEFYSGCTDLLLDHRDGTLSRKSHVTHSPLPGPRLGF